MKRQRRNSDNGSGLSKVPKLSDAAQNVNASTSQDSFEFKVSLRSQSKAEQNDPKPVGYLKELFKSMDLQPGDLGAVLHRTSLDTSPIPQSPLVENEEDDLEMAGFAGSLANTKQAPRVLSLLTL